MSKQFHLSKKKKKWVKQFKPTAVLRGSALNYPMGVERRFTREFTAIIDAVMKATEKEVAKIFSTPAAQAYFATDAEDESISDIAEAKVAQLTSQLSLEVQRRALIVARRMVHAANTSSRASMASSIKALAGGVTLDPGLLSGAIQDKLKAAINVNANLIVNASDVYLAKVADAVNRSIMFGNGLEDLIPFFEKQKGITKRHAKNVALDQTRKAYNSLNVARMENVGLSKFEWLHSGGGQVPRKFHKDNFPKGLNGGIFDIHDPPVIDPKTGEKGLPSLLPNCKCRMVPVLVLDSGAMV